MIQRNENDMAVCPFTAFERRLQITDFGFSYNRKRFIVISRKSEYSGVPTAFLPPFVLGVWLDILVSFLQKL